MKLTRLIVALFVFALPGAGFSQEAKSVSDYRREADAAVESISIRESQRLAEDDAVIFIDVRDSSELEKDGKIDGAVHVPRGFLEFIIDPKSPMHNEAFSSDKKVVFYCETSGRSMLAAKLAKDMGVADPVYLKGGFRAWARAGADVVNER